VKKLVDINGTVIEPNHVPVEEGIHEFSKLICNEISQNNVSI